MAIRVNKPYKIIDEKVKLYERHCQIPSAKFLINPTRILGGEVACDICWQIDNEAHIILHVVSIGENPLPIQPLEVDELYTLWTLHRTVYTAHIKS